MEHDDQIAMHHVTPNHGKNLLACCHAVQFGNECAPRLLGGRTQRLHPFAIGAPRFESCDGTVRLPGCHLVHPNLRGHIDRLLIVPILGRA